MFRFIFSGTLENAVVVQALRWSMRDGACMMSCNSVNRNVFMWNQNTDNKSLMPGWSVFYGLRNDSPANACCRRCASLQKQECATPYRYCRGLEMALCTWARLFICWQIQWHAEYKDIFSLFYILIVIWVSFNNLNRDYVTLGCAHLQYQSRYFGSKIPCLGKLVDH